MKNLFAAAALSIALLIPAAAEDLASHDPAFSVHRAAARPAARPVAARHASIYSYHESAYRSLPTSLSEVICQEAQRNDVDPLIIHIIIGHESAFNSDATSKVGACGLMQLMPETAAELGVTDINDPRQNVAAGTRYFAEQYRRFGDLRLALAAYNAGPAAVASAHGVPAYDETLNYVSSITGEYERRKRRA